jgi:hypothetical protein
VFGHSAATDRERNAPTRKGDKVRFRRADIFLPDTSESVKTTSGDEDLEGTVVGFSDSGEVEYAFAIVEVTTGQSAVVRVEKLTRMAMTSEETPPQAK